MQNLHFLASYSIFAFCVILLPFVGGIFHEEISKSSNHKSIKENLPKLSPQMTYHIAVHGLLLWSSVGFLMPVGLLTIRMSNIRKEISGGTAGVFFYLHVLLQMLSVILATIGAIMSIKNFENSFNNSHQRLGLALYAAMWVQAPIGFFKPSRGNKRRSVWYFLHWLLGTVTSVGGIINIYTGLNAYHTKTSRSTTLWTILFTAEIFFIVFIYLFQDKWEYMKKQGVILDNNVEPVSTSTQVITEMDNEKVLFPAEPYGKRNALKNLFK